MMGGHAARAATRRTPRPRGSGMRSAPAHVVATGGGPGAMEAANLGAWPSRHDARVTGRSGGRLAEVPAFRPSVDDWLRRPRGRARVAEPRDSLGIPTWHYGHEPSNVFATAIAKYFRNATREAILLEVCDAGIVFLPGAGGTVQEVFQDACENYYADESSVAPMVLVGATYWTETLPAWPLLQSLARGRPMEDRIHLVDTSTRPSGSLMASGGAAAVAGHRAGRPPRGSARRAPR